MRLVPRLPHFLNSVDRHSVQRSGRLSEISVPFLGRAAAAFASPTQPISATISFILCSSCTARMCLHVTVPLRLPGQSQYSASFPTTVVYAFPFAVCDGTWYLPSPRISIPFSLESISITSFAAFFEILSAIRGAGNRHLINLFIRKRSFTRTRAESFRSFVEPLRIKAQKTFLTL